MDYSKLKVADLKKELKNRGLSTVGNKTELQERLQLATLEETESVLDPNVSDLLDEDVLIVSTNGHHLNEFPRTHIILLNFVSG